MNESTLFTNKPTFKYVPNAKYNKKYYGISNPSPR